MCNGIFWANCYNKQLTALRPTRYSYCPANDISNFRTKYLSSKQPSSWTKIWHRAPKCHLNHNKISLLFQLPFPDLSVQLRYYQHIHSTIRGLKTKTYQYCDYLRRWQAISLTLCGWRVNTKETNIKCVPLNFRAYMNKKWGLMSSFGMSKIRSPNANFDNISPWHCQQSLDDSRGKQTGFGYRKPNGRLCWRVGPTRRKSKWLLNLGMGSSKLFSEFESFRVLEKWIVSSTSFSGSLEFFFSSFLRKFRASSRFFPYCQLPPKSWFLKWYLAEFSEIGN